MYRITIQKALHQGFTSLVNWEQFLTELKAMAIPDHFYYPISDKYIIGDEDYLVLKLKYPDIIYTLCLYNLNNVQCKPRAHPVST